MREILFRGKNLYKDEWVYGVPVKTNSLSGVSLITELYHVDGAEYNAIECDIIPETVGQFTGLTDKNGTKIFEGDIRDFNGGLGQVIWYDAAFAIKSPGSEAVDWEHSSVFINSTLLTTIHDNPTT